MMMTEEEQSWLVKYYWSIRPLERTHAFAISHLTEVEAELIGKGLAVVKDAQEWRLTPPGDLSTLYVSVSELGKDYVVEHQLLDLLLRGIHLQRYQEVMHILEQLPAERLPELIVCENATLRNFVNTQLAKRNGAKCNPQNLMRRHSIF